MVLITISEIAEEFRCSRDTARKKLADAGITPAGKRKSRNVYRVRDVVRALTAADADAFAARARVQTELLEVELRKKCGELCDVHDVEQEMARLLKVLITGLDSLTDRVERDVGASQAVLDYIDRATDELRVELYTAISGKAPTREPGETT